MIGFLKGKIFSKKPSKIILLVNNIGYEINISLQTFQKLKEVNEEEELFIYTIHKEDSYTLYGFKTEEEKELFKILISISGIGPKMGLLILSKIDTKKFKQAVVEQDVEILTSIGGIGKKRAEKLLFELKEKFKDFVSEGIPKSGGGMFTQNQEDAVLGLISLGYTRNEAMNLVKQISDGEKLSVEELIRRALVIK